MLHPARPLAIVGQHRRPVDVEAGLIGDVGDRHPAADTAVGDIEDGLAKRTGLERMKKK